jgi:hypothetical protein
MTTLEQLNRISRLLPPDVGANVMTPEEKKHLTKVKRHTTAAPPSPPGCEYCLPAEGRFDPDIFKASPAKMFKLR